MAELASTEIQERVWKKDWEYHCPFTDCGGFAHALLDVSLKGFDDFKDDFGLSLTQMKSIHETLACLEALSEKHKNTFEYELLCGDSIWSEIITSANLYMAASNAPTDFKEFLMSAKRFEKPEPMPNPFLDPNDVLYIEVLQREEEARQIMLEDDLARERKTKAKKWLKLKVANMSRLRTAAVVVICIGITLIFGRDPNKWLFVIAMYLCALILVMAEGKRSNVDPDKNESGETQ